MTRALVLLCSFASIGCGGLTSWPDRCDFSAGPACVVVDSRVAVDPSHVEHQVANALAYWGAPESVLDGYTIEFTADPIDCPIADLPDPSRPVGSPDGPSGCTLLWSSGKRIRLQPEDSRCPETAPLVHEIGHVLYGADPHHEGPWWNFLEEEVATYTIIIDGTASPGCADFMHDRYGA